MIGNLIKNGMWECRGAIGAFTAGTPLAIEGAILAKNIFNNPQFQAFTPQKEETQSQAILRISRNVFLLIAFLAISAAALYLTVQFLPLAAAIPVTLTTIFYAGKALANAPDFFKQFSIQPGEDPQEAKRRIAKLMIKVVVVATLGLAALALGAYVVYPILTVGFSWSISLPFQTKPVVFAEYAFVGLVHLGLAIHNYIKGDKKNGLFHLFAAALSIIFPLYYWNHEMRLHHSFLGLILMALPFRSMKFIGTAITFDSSLYMFSPHRGNFDFMNILWGNFPLYAGTLSGAMLAEGINDTYEEGAGVKTLTLPEVKS